MIPNSELIANDTLLKYSVTYEYTGTTVAFGANPGHRQTLTDFDRYDLAAFVNAAPNYNWEIRTITQYQVPNR